MKVGANVGGGANYWSGNMIFSNLMLQAMPFQNTKNIPLRPDGYPVMAGGDAGGVLTLVSSNEVLEKGTYTLTADGTGTIIIGEIPFFSDGPWNWRSFEFDGTKKSYKLECPGLPQIKQMPIQLCIARSEANDPIHNIQLTIPNAKKEHPFNPKFISNLSIFSQLRFTDWVNYNVAVGTWSQRDVSSFNVTSRGMINYEYIFQLCNVTGKDCWLNLPFNADDDYIQNLAALADKMLNKNISIYVEFSNETWNWAFNTAQSLYQESLAIKEDFWTYVAKKDGRAINLFKKTLSPDRKCIRVVARQQWDATIRTAIDVMKANNLEFDAIAVAPYFSHTLSPERFSAINAQYKKGQKSEAITKVLSSMHGSIDEVLNNTRVYKQIADANNVPLHLYEFGQHLCEWQNDDYNDLLMACNRDVRMGSSLYNKYFTMLNSLGVASGNIYCECSVWSRWGYWGHLEYTNQPESEVPKWRVAKRFALSGNK